MNSGATSTRHSLESIADIQYGLTAKACQEPIGPKFLRITDIQAGAVDWDAVPFCEVTKAERQKFSLSPGEIVFARTGATTGKSYLINDEVDAVFASYLIRVRPRNESICPRYLAYYFQTDEYWAEIAAGTEGAAQGGFNASKLSQLRIPIPSAREQKRIVAVLDQAFAALDRARAHAEANLADAKALFESKLHRVFNELGARFDRLGFDQLCEAVTPKTKIKRQDYLAEGSYPVVSQEADIVSGYWNDPEALLGLTQPVVVFGDHTRCLKYIDFDFVVGADGTKVLKPKKGISAAYLYFGLRSKPIAEKGYARHFKFVRDIELPDIPLLEQHKLAENLFNFENETARLLDAYEQKLADLANFRQSLLEKAFVGQLT